MIPGLERAEFVRFGMVHRNTYVNGPTVLADTWQVRAQADAVLRRTDVGRRGLRRVGGVGSARRPQRRGAGVGRAGLARRRGRRRSARWRTTCRTRIRRTTSRRTSLSASWRRSIGRRAARRTANSRIAERALEALDVQWMHATTHLKAFLQHLALNRNASAHTVRAYDSDLSRFHRPRRRGSRRQERRRSRPTQLDRSAIRGFLASCTAAAVARDGGAQARRGAHVPALPPPRGADRRRSRRAGRDAEARDPDAGAPSEAGDDGAARRRRRGDAARRAATARSSSCSTRRACA